MNLDIRVITLELFVRQASQIKDERNEKLRYETLEGVKRKIINVKTPGNINSEIKMNAKIHREQNIKLLRKCGLLVIESLIHGQRYAPTKWLVILLLLFTLCSG